jgi:hypothetical protein
VKERQTEIFGQNLQNLHNLSTGASVARMWLSKKANFHKRACVRFTFLTANPVKPGSDARAGVSE